MDKKLKKYTQFAKTEIDKLASDLKKSKNAEDIKLTHENTKKLFAYHEHTIRNFQHERLVHLIVTFFFAGLLLAFISALLLLALIPTDSSYIYLSNLVAFICLILFVTELFYIKHYYDLENGTQKLYELSARLYEIEKSDNI